MKAQKLFNETFFGFLEKLFLIVSFGEISGFGLTQAQHALSSKYSGLLKNLLQSPAYAGMLGQPTALLARDLPSQLTRKLTDRALEKAVGSVEGACFIYAHTLLDTALSDYCRAAAMADPKGWRALAAKAASPDSKAMAAGAAYERRRGPLIERVDLLTAGCRPPAGWAPAPGIRLDRRRIERLDRLRERAVREGGKVPRAEDEMLFMVRTALYLATLLCLRYGFRIDPAVLLR
ncbi:MAG: hypothetical protein ABII00_17805 [Elusimicrobiota bacterium]